MQYRVDITLTTAAGARVALSAVARGQPLLLTFVFTRCAGVWSLFLRSWRAADRSVSRPSAFHRLVLSFDPRDSATDTGRVVLDWGLALLLVPVGVAGFTTAVMFVTGARIRRAAGTRSASSMPAAS